jgi:hypothetical protein
MCCSTFVNLRRNLNRSEAALARIKISKPGEGHCGRGRHCRRCPHHSTSPEQHELYIRRSRDRSQSRLRPISRVCAWNLHRASVNRRRPCAYKYLRIYKNHISACKNPKTMVQHGTSSHSPAENAPEGRLPCQKTMPKHCGPGRHCRRCPHHNIPLRLSTWNTHGASAKPLFFNMLRLRPLSPLMESQHHKLEALHEITNVVLSLRIEEA